MAQSTPAPTAVVLQQTEKQNKKLTGRLLTKQELSEIKSALEEQKKQQEIILREAKETLEKQSAPRSYSKHSEDGTYCDLLHRRSGEAQGAGKMLTLIDEALGRILKNTYTGTCIICKKQIPIERLLVVPVTQKCLPCKNKEH